MPVYETVFIVKPQLSDADIGAIVDKTKKLIASDGGELLNEDKWGRRKLSYQIQHCREGFYVYLKYQAPPTLTGKLDQYFRIQEPVIRTLTVRQHVRRPLPKKAKTKAKTKAKA